MSTLLSFYVIQTNNLRGECVRYTMTNVQLVCKCVRYPRPISRLLSLFSLRIVFTPLKQNCVYAGIKYVHLFIQELVHLSATKCKIMYHEQMDEPGSNKFCPHTYVTMVPSQANFLLSSNCVRFCCLVRDCAHFCCLVRDCTFLLSSNCVHFCCLVKDYVHFCFLVRDYVQFCCPVTVYISVV